MSTLNDKHNTEVLRLTSILRNNARLAGIHLDRVMAAGFVRTVLDNYKPVGVWSEFPGTDSCWIRSGVWKRWEIRIGRQLFSYEMLEQDVYKRDPRYLAYVKRAIQRRMGTSIAAWVTGEEDADQHRDPVEIRESNDHQ